MFRKTAHLIVLVSCCMIATGQDKMPPAMVEGIYFYGLGGRDSGALKAALPFHIGEKFSDPIKLIEVMGSKMS